MTYRLTVEEGPYLTLYRAEADDFEGLMEQARADSDALSRALSRKYAIAFACNDNRADLDDDGLTDEERDKLSEVVA